MSNYGIFLAHMSLTQPYQRQIIIPLDIFCEFIRGKEFMTGRDEWLLDVQVVPI